MTMSNDNIETKRVLRLTEYLGPVEDINTMLADTLSGPVSTRSKVGKISIRTVVMSGEDSLLKLFHKEFERGIEAGKRMVEKRPAFEQPRIVVGCCGLVGAKDTYCYLSKGHDGSHLFIPLAESERLCNCVQNKTASDLCPVHGSR